MLVSSARKAFLSTRKLLQKGEIWHSRVSSCRKVILNSYQESRYLELCDRKLLCSATV